MRPRLIDMQVRCKENTERVEMKEPKRVDKRY